MNIQPILLTGKVLTGTEKLDGTQIIAMTIIGLLVVFSALLILVLFLYLSGSFFKSTAGKKKSAPKQAPKPAPAKAAPKPAQKPAAAKPQPAPAAEDDTEVIAVIMAAIAAMGAAEGKQYQLRSVTPAAPRRGRSVWAQAGLSEATRPF